MLYSCSTPDLFMLYSCSPIRSRSGSCSFSSTAAW
jgi:hypothetical protein